MPMLKIRWKFLILLLAIALVPLVVSSLMQRRWASRQGQQLAAEQREVLINSARGSLQLIIDDYARTLVQMRDVLETVVQVQAQEVSAALAGEVPPDAQAFPVDWIDQWGGSDEHPALEIGEKDGWGPDGDPIVQLIAPNNHSVIYFGDEESVQADVVRVAGVTDKLLLLRGAWPGLIQWQHTTLTEGAHLCLPGHGGYSHGYDARQRPSYTSAKAAGELKWTPVIDVSTGLFMVTISMPIYESGELVAMTSVDVPLSAMVANLHMPDEWQDAATVLFARVETDGSVVALAQIDSDGDVVALAETDFKAEGSREDDVTERVISSSDQAELEQLTGEVLAGRGGVRKLDFQGRSAFWAYGPGQSGRAFPLIILPHTLIDDPADEAELFIQQQIAKGLKITGIILLSVVGLVTLVAVGSSKRLTRPIHELVDATTKLRDGDFEARVEIHTRDELEELGDTFNAMVPKLLENQELRQSLEVAMEIQQHLLPQEPPVLAGFDIFGQTRYCDETGGDYYDFIPLEPEKMGVTLGDITGHGIGAAVLMASARGVLRSHAVHYGEDLVGLFDVLNAHLEADTDAGRFMTLYYAVLDATAGGRKVTWISGGHDPAFWLRADGTIDELTNGGLPLGIIEEGGYTANEPFHLADGEILLIGSDGIWEAENAEKEMFGKDRLRELLRSHSGQTAEAINRQVVAAVLAFVGDSPRTDDITLTVVRAV